MLEILLRNKTDAHHYFETVYKLDDFRTMAICTWSLGKQWLNRMNDNLGTIDITYNECLIDTITINGIKFQKKISSNCILWSNPIKQLDLLHSTGLLLEDHP